MSFASDMQGVAQELLTEFGQPVNLIRHTNGAYDPATSDVEEVGDDTYEGIGHPEPYTSAEVATGTVLTSDIKLLFYSVTGVPIVGDSVQIDGDEYRVMSVDKLKAQGQSIVYILQLRI